MRVLAGVVLHGLWRAAVGISLAQDGIHGATFYFVVAGLGVLLGVIRWRLGVIGHRESASLQLSDRRLQLRNRRADVREFDDVRLRLESQGAEFCEGVGGFLIFRQAVGENRQNATRQRDVAEFHRNPCVFGKSLNDGEKRVGGQQRGFVCLGVENSGWLGHGRKG